MNRFLLILGIVCLIAWSVLFFTSDISWLHPLTFFGVAFTVLGVIWNKSPNYHIGHN